MKTWLANWIWLPGQQRKPNFHFYARKELDLHQQPETALLHISAYTDYHLYVNGRYVGRGPNPSSPAQQFYDTYDLRPFLHAGRNVVAALVHNYAVGLHWHPMGPGGFIAEIELVSGGQRQVFGTDATWKVAPAAGYNLHSPRMMWSCQYLETFEAKYFDPAWCTIEFDDRNWGAPEVLGSPPLHPWDRLNAREIPFLREEPVGPISLEQGRYHIEGFHAISFSDLEEPETNRLYYARTYLHSEHDRRVTLYLSCDDAFKVFLNGLVVHEQSYDEAFVREQLWVGREDYEQFHNGVGPRAEVASVDLKAGWNQLVIVVDQCPEGWGFSLGFVDVNLGPVDRWFAYNHPGFMVLDYSSTLERQDHRWELHGPFESSGLKNSLDLIRTDAIPNGGQHTLFDSQNHLRITDYDLLMRSEKRSDFTPLKPGEAVYLKAGECVVTDLGQVNLGFPHLVVESTAGTVLDIGTGNVLSEERGLLYMYQVRCVDRLYLTEGGLDWQALPTREARYLHLSCRSGSLTIKSMGLTSVGYPVQEPGNFECSDPLLNRLWQASKRNTQLLMQDGYQDCIRRENGLHNARSFLHAFPAAMHEFGDTALIKKTIRDALRTQDETGWFCGQGYCDNSWDEPTKMMWTYGLVTVYYQYTGDVEFVAEIYPRLQCGVRFFSRLENKQILLDSNNEYRDLRGRAIYLDDHLLRPPYIHSFDVVLLGYNILYIDVLTSLAVLAEALGHTAEADFYRKKAAQVKRSCNEVFWDAERENYVDWIRGAERASSCPEAVLVLALFYNICPTPYKSKILEELFGDQIPFQTRLENYPFTFGFYYFILELLFQNGLEAKAYEVLRTYYGGWLSLGMTTMGEHYSLLEARGRTSLGRDYNVHGYGTSAHIHFFKNILGMRPLEPGFTKVLIAPKPGDLTWAQGNMWTPRGVIEVAWKRATDGFCLDVNLPAGVRYEVSLPAGEGGAVSVNGDCRVIAATKG